MTCFGSNEENMGPVTYTLQQHLYGFEIEGGDREREREGGEREEERDRR